MAEWQSKRGGRGEIRSRGDKTLLDRDKKDQCSILRSTVTEKWQMYGGGDKRTNVPQMTKTYEASANEKLPAILSNVSCLSSKSCATHRNHFE